MKKYSFELLTWFDFENLSRDVVQTREGIELESFSEGKDGGIDFRRIFNKDKSLVVQSKHYKDFPTCMRELKKEVEKVKKLNPSRYILVLSIDATPLQKDQIVKLFSPYIKNPKDVILRGDIENIVDRNEDVLKRNYKLWFTSASVIEILNNKKISKRSQHLKKQISDKAKLYVETDNIDRSLKVLNELNAVIISGIPGIGKTTLAEMLTLFHIEQGYEVVYVTTIDEAEEALDEKKKQIIYYDDFLGSNFLKSPLYKNEDTRLVDIFERVKTSKKSRMIMTTREYILRQAESELEALGRSRISVDKILVDLGSYTEFQKAQILYNHLYFSSLPKQKLKEILNDKNYKKIIEHRNYNPRLIETIINNSQRDDGSIIKLFEEALDKPEIIWEKAFANQISEGARFLLYSLVISPQDITIEDLEEVYYGLIGNYKKVSNLDVTSGDFKTSIKELDDTFIKIDLKDGHRVVGFHNPSITDFLVHYLSDEKVLRKALITSATYLVPLVENFSPAGTSQHKILISSIEQREIYKKIINEFFKFKDVDKEFAHELLNRAYLLYVKLLYHKSQPLKDFLKTLLTENLKAEHYEEDFIITYFSMLEGLDLVTPEVVKREIRKITKDPYAVVDLEALQMLASDYEQELTEVIEEDGLDRQELISEILAGYTDNIHDFDERQLEDVAERVDEFENLLDVNLSGTREKIDEAQAKINYYEQMSVESSDWRDREQSFSSVPADPIDSLFNTLPID